METENCTGGFLYDWWSITDYKKPVCLDQREEHKPAITLFEVNLFGHRVMVANCLSPFCHSI